MFFFTYYIPGHGKSKIIMSQRHSVGLDVQIFSEPQLSLRRVIETFYDSSWIKRIMMNFLDHFLISFGVPITLILFHVLFYPLRIITFITGATFWLISLLISSILWYAVVPLRSYLVFGLIFSVIFQELIRILFLHVLHKLDKGIKSLSTSKNSVNDVNMNENRHIDNQDNFNNGENPLLSNNEMNHKNEKISKVFDVDTFAYVGGLGFGVMAGLFASMDLLSALSGPGTFGLYKQPLNFVSLYSFQVLNLVLLHTSIGVIMSKAYQRKSYLLMGIILMLHMVFSCLTLLNTQLSPASEIIITINTILTTGSICWAFKSVGGVINRLPDVIYTNFHYWFTHLRSK